MEMKAGLTFACMNLKKLAKILEKARLEHCQIFVDFEENKKKRSFKEKWCWA